MPKLECALTDSLIRPLDAPPLLSIVIPTYNRTDELVLAATSIAQQLEGLEDKVEIVITDNASGQPTVEAIRALADRYPTISYLLHARNEGGFFQLFSAPWRARGRYTWVFGSDDALLPGGVEHAVEILEREAPGFMTINKKVANADLSQELSPFHNSVPARRFDSFIELMCALGMNQLAFISGNIEATEAARAIDAEPFLTGDSRHPHVAGFLAKHAHAPAYYSDQAYVVHRVDNSVLGDYHIGNFFDYAVTFPMCLAPVIKAVGAPEDLLERMTGDKRIESYDPPQFTYVDSMFENMLRALAGGRMMNLMQRRALENILGPLGGVRLEQLGEIWKMQDRIQGMEDHAEKGRAGAAMARQACLSASRMFTRQ